MEPRVSDAGERSTTMWWVVAIFFMNAALSLARGEWLMATLHAFAGVAFWKDDWVESRRGWLRYLIIAGLAALVIATFVQLLQRARAQF